MPACFCPHCKTRLWVKETQLNVAQGFVVCQNAKGCLKPKTIWQARKNLYSTICPKLFRMSNSSTASARTPLARNRFPRRNRRYPQRRYNPARYAARNRRCRTCRRTAGFRTARPSGRAQLDYCNPVRTYRPHYAAFLPLHPMNAPDSFVAHFREAAPTSAKCAARHWSPA